MEKGQERTEARLRKMVIRRKGCEEELFGVVDLEVIIFERGERRFDVILKKNHFLEDL